MRIAPLSWWILACVTAIVAVLLQAPDAWAIGDDVTLGNFSCSGGTANGQLLISGASCPTTLRFDNLFSFLICNFEQLSSNLLGHMFCGMVSDLTPAVWAAVTLAVIVFGVSFTIGLVPATGQEAMVFLIKLAFITTFATNADYLIGFGYKILIVGMREGVTIMLTTLNDTGINSGADVYGEVDKILAELFRYASDAIGAQAKADFCKNAIFAVIALMAIALPVAAYVGLLLIGRMLLTLFRSVFAYIYALMGIAFLLTLSPFFLTFFLFKITRNLFDRWIGYLVSFALQVILLFAFLTFIVVMVKSIQDSNVATDLAAIVVPDTRAVEGTSLRFPLKYCTLCDFEVVSRENGAVLDPESPDYISKGKLQCKPSNLPITINFASSPDALKSKESPVRKLLTFLLQGIIPLIVLVLMIEHLLALLPALAQRLASGLGASYASQQGGGQATAAGGVTRLPGESYIDNFTTGFNTGFKDAPGRDSISKTFQGFKDGLAGMVTGRTSDGRRLDGAEEGSGTPETAGKRNSFSRWLRDPSSFGQ